MLIDTEDEPPSSPSKSSPQSVYSKARGLLRCNTLMNWSVDGSPTPETTIAARDTEREAIHAFLSGGGFLQRHPSTPDVSSLYISGSPGTGKTALVTDVLRRLQGDAEWITVYVNCMGLSTTVAVWHQVWTQVAAGSGQSSKSDVKPKDAKRRLEGVLSDEDSPRMYVHLISSLT